MSRAGNAGERPVTKWPTGGGKPQLCSSGWFIGSIHDAGHAVAFPNFALRDLRGVAVWDQNARAMDGAALCEGSCPVPEAVSSMEFVSL
jgi:hypothetical protein